MKNPSTSLRRRASLVLAALGLAGATACTPGALSRGALDLTMGSAYRAPTPLPGRGLDLDLAASRVAAHEASPRYQLLAGDLHCHVSPPDAPSDVDRGVTETVALARSEGLDFVVLTPHVGARFFTDDAARARVLAGREVLRAALAREDTHGITFVIGMEYTDHRYGHVGASFADLEQVLAEVPASIAAAHPERFFEAFAARRGLLVVNHPLVTPLDSIVAIARANLSWRPFTAAGPFPAEIVAVNRVAQAFEVYNLPATHLRDRFLLHDTDHTIHATLARLDQEIVAQRRPMTPVGGSDTHTHHLRATTFVLARGRAEADIHEALLAGRTCVRAPEACSFEARAPGGRWTTVGGAVRGDSVEVRADGDDVDILLDGVSVERPDDGPAARVALDPKRCSVLRARVGEGYSAPIYANCAFAVAALD